jgi:hypothetical protein
VSVSTIIFEFIDGPDKGRTVRMSDRRAILLGRGRDADLRLAATDRTLSRHQAYIELSAGDSVLKRIAGSNPVVDLNGRPVARNHVLVDGDILRLGETTLRVSLVTCDEGCWFCGEAVTPGASVGEEREIDVYAHEDCVDSARSTTMELFGPYEAFRTIAVSPMGPLYNVYDRKARRIWALKRLADVAWAQSFESVLHDLRRLRHGNIIRYVYGDVDQAGLPYVVMEYARGGNVAEFARTLPAARKIPAIIQLMDDALEGLNVLHEGGKVHGDLRPSNILVQLVDRAGSDDKYCGKLAGLGDLKSPSPDGPSSKPPANCGTQPFRAPEHTSGLCDPRIDIYSLGLTFYFLLAGHLPALAPNDEAQVPGAPWPDSLRTALVERCPEVDAGLAAAIDRACDPDPEARFASARAFQRALRQP